MLTLAWDGSGPRLCVAVADAKGCLLGEARDDVRAQQLLSLVDRALDHAGATASDLSRIAVGTGPGAFTGLRVTVTTARGMALALELSLAALDSLALVSWPLLHEGPVDSRAWAVIDARRNERFAQLRQGHDCKPAGVVHIVPTPDLNDLLATEHADLPRALLEPVTPLALAALSACATYTDPLLIVPRYGREPDATVPQLRGLAR